MESATEAEVSKSYRKIDRSPPNEGTMIVVYLVLSLIYVGFLFKVMLTTGSTGWSIALATIVFALSMALVHYSLDRCPQCRTKPLRLRNADGNGKRFVLCRTCKTYYEEVPAELMV